MQSLDVVHEIEGMNAFGLGLVTGVQVAPPSVVFTIAVPDEDTPTAMQSLALVQEMSLKLCSVDREELCHALPASVVRRE